MSSRSDRAAAGRGRRGGRRRAARAESRRRELGEAWLRLHAAPDAAALTAEILRGTADLLDPQRVLLVLRQAGALRVAGSRLPRGEDPAALLKAITPWLDEAARTRRARLWHGPDGASPRNQRSCLVAPLVALDETVGFLYADVEGSVGRFEAPDRDLLELLAAHAGLALVGPRPATAASLRAPQPESGLAPVNEILQGISAGLDFNAIIELVG